MALFQMKWLRRFVRRHTSPVPMSRAELWKRRLSVAYMILSWQAFGLVLYLTYTGRGDWAKHFGLKSEEETEMSAGQYFSKTLNVEKGKIIRFSGLTKVSEEEINPEKPSNS